MYIVAIGWLYVVLMMAVMVGVKDGNIFGAFMTFFFYGLAPCSVVMYLLGAPGRGRARKKLAAEETAAEPKTLVNDSTHENDRANTKRD